jgi:hypothetical protein
MIWICRNTSGKWHLLDILQLKEAFRWIGGKFSAGIFNEKSRLSVRYKLHTHIDEKIETHIRNYHVNTNFL